MDPVELIKEMSIAQNKLDESEIILTGLLHKEGLPEKYIRGGLSYYRLNLSRFEKYLNNPQLAVGPILNNIKNSQGKPYRTGAHYKNTLGSEQNYTKDEVDDKILYLRKKWLENEISHNLVMMGLKMLDNWIDTVVQ